MKRETAMIKRKNKDKIIIGLSGKKYNGKDTVADYWCTNAGFKKFSLATPVKDITMTAFGLDEEQVYNPLYKDALLFAYPHKSPRELMEYVGNKFREEFPTIWIENLKRRMLNADCRACIIADIRFPNELELCDYVVRVNRPALSSNNATSISETSLDDYEFDYVIENETNQLFKTFIKADDVLKEIFKKEGMSL